MQQDIFKDQAQAQQFTSFAFAGRSSIVNFFGDFVDALPAEYQRCRHCFHDRVSFRCGFFGHVFYLLYISERRGGFPAVGGIFMWVAAVWRMYLKN